VKAEKPTVTGWRRVFKSKRQVLNLVFLVVGVAILVSVTAKIGWHKTYDHLGMVGWGFIYVLAAYLASTLMEVAAWRLAIRGGAVPLWRLLGMALGATATSSMTPLGEAGEVVKATMLGSLVPIERSVSSVLTWNLYYRITKHVVIVVSVLTLYLFSRDLFEPRLYWAFVGAAVISSVPTVLFGWFLFKGSARLSIRLFRKLKFFRNADQTQLEQTAAEIDSEVRFFVRDHTLRAVSMMLLLTGARLFAALEVHIIFLLFGLNFSFATSFFLYCASMVVRILTSFSPVQLGVGEGSEAVLYRLLGYPLSLGFSQAFIRMLRHLLFTAIGFTYMAVHSVLDHRSSVEPE